ncbi:MAG: hypothetical protein LBJ00_18145, partial [Planctomycetaceae bacterium]|nr:hypothetical protein [Planctomycetaceae bacterium]
MHQHNHLPVRPHSRKIYKHPSCRRKNLNITPCPNTQINIIQPLTLLYSSCFKIPEAAVNLQRRALCKRNNMKRLFRGEAYCFTSY